MIVHVITVTPTYQWQTRLPLPDVRPVHFILNLKYNPFPSSPLLEAYNIGNTNIFPNTNLESPVHLSSSHSSYYSPGLQNREPLFTIVFLLSATFLYPRGIRHLLSL